MERENRRVSHKLKQCCSSCSICQKCTKNNKVYKEEDSDLDDLPSSITRVGWEPMKGTRSNSNTPGKSSILPYEGKPREQPVVLLAPLREEVGPDRTMMLLKVPFNTSDLEIWKRNVKDYRKDSISIAGHFQ
ncbi:hypothetical protein Nmel_009439 [Mimus melanotis]